MERITFKIIPPEEISREFPYRCRYRFEDAGLCASMAKHGMVQPVLLTPPPKRQVVSGHKRLHAAAGLGLEEVPVLELASQPSEEDLFILSLISNFNSRFSDLDNAWTLRRAVEHFRLNEKTIFEEVFPCLGLASGRHVLKEFLDVAGLDPTLLEAVASGKLPFRGCHMLSRFSERDQQVFGRTIAAKISLTTNQLLQISEWLFDLTKSEKTDLKTFLTQKGLQGVLEQEKGDPRQKAEKFCEVLWRIRFPRRAEREKKFTAFSREIRNRSRDISLEAPPGFEQEGYLLKAKIRRPETLDEVLDLVRARRDCLNSLFDIVL